MRRCRNSERPEPGGRKDLFRPHPVHHLAEPLARQRVLPVAVEQPPDDAGDLFFGYQPVGLDADPEDPARPPAEIEAHPLRRDADRLHGADGDAVAAADAVLFRMAGLAVDNPDRPFPADRLARPAAVALAGAVGREPPAHHPDVV